MQKHHFGSVGPDGNPALLSRSVKVGPLVYTAGVVPPRNPMTGRVADGIEAQTEGVLTRLADVLSEAGAKLSDVVKVNIYLTNMNDFQAMNGVYRRFFPTEAPARTTVQVAGLAVPEFLIEIEMVALAPQ